MLSGTRVSEKHPGIGGTAKLCCRLAGASGPVDLTAIPQVLPDTPMYGRSGRRSVELQMGQAQQRKKAREALARALPELEAKLAEQLVLLKEVGRLYDEVTPAAALPLATCLRVLLHDTAKSHALLEQVGALTSTLFADTAMPIDPRNLLPAHNGLVVLQVQRGSGGSYVPRCVADAAWDNPPLRFSTWWSAVVLRDAQRRTWVRRDVVLALANKEGGAHLDPSQPEEIKALERENSMGWVYIEGDEQSPFLNSPLPATVRQIAHEVLVTLQSPETRDA